MCWVSSISSSTSRNISFRLSGPLSRTSRKISGSPRAVAPLTSSRDEPKQTDNSSSMIPVRFPSILPPSSLCRLARSTAVWRTEDAQPAKQLDPLLFGKSEEWWLFFFWKKKWSGSDSTEWKRFTLRFIDKRVGCGSKQWCASVIKEQKVLQTLPDVLLETQVASEQCSSSRSSIAFPVTLTRLRACFQILTSLSTLISQKLVPIKFV